MEIIPHDFHVGDDVSYGFNGDWYPDGQVARITKKYLTTTNGRKYSLYTYYDHKHIRDTVTNRVIDCVEVIKEGFHSINGGTWKLVKGVYNERNPHF